MIRNIMILKEICPYANYKGDYVPDAGYEEGDGDNIDELWCKSDAGQCWACPSFPAGRRTWDPAMSMHTIYCTKHIAYHIS